MLAVVINERVPRGWLEFLTRVQLDKSAFDVHKELKRADGGGAEKVLRLRDATANLEAAEALGHKTDDVGAFCAAFEGARLAASRMTYDAELATRVRDLEERGAELATLAFMPMIE